MKVVFLDLDGVANSTTWWTYRTPEQRRFDESRRGIMGGIDPAAMARINALCARTGALVVVSSTERLRRSLTELRQVLEHYGFEGQVLDKTPRLSGQPRGREIQAWLDHWSKHREAPESFVILDDDADMEHLASRLVKTSCVTGLLDEHVERAESMLQGAEVAR